MKAEIGYCIVMLSRVMRLASASHLESWMVYFIEKIKALESLNWSSLLSDSLHDYLVRILIEPKFYITSYIVYLLVAQHPNYPTLTKRGSMQEP